MKKIQYTFEGTGDPTGYLFSLAKCLSAALRCSRYHEYADDIIAASGFAFRMWAAEDLCPSATSIWEFKKQKPWVENGGLVCDYAERLWGQDEIEEQQRQKAVDMIRRSIDDGVAAVAWDVSGCEWGAVTGYDDEQSLFSIYKINGTGDTLPYDKLGRLELPILSVLTVTGEKQKTPEQLVADTKKLAVSHLKGEEWCDNKKGMEVYDFLIRYIQESLSGDTAWNLEYYLGTYTSLKWYAWKFFEKYGEENLARLYQTVYTAWKSAFDSKCSGDVSDPDTRRGMMEALERAKEAEGKALNRMEHEM